MTDPNDEMAVLPALTTFRDTAQHAFVPPSVASVAASAHRRHRRRIGVVTAATVLLVGVGSAVAATQLSRQTAPPFTDSTPSPSLTPGPSPSPSSSQPPAPSRAVSVEEALLTPKDLGPGYTIADPQELGDWHLEYLTQICPHYKHQTYPGPPPAKPEGHERGLNGPKGVTQRVDRTDAGHTRWQMDDLRRWIGDCASFTSENIQYRMQIISTGFAGDDSFLVKMNQDHWVYVRKGALISQIGFDRDHTLAEMKDIAVKAAARM